jgi:hypothetical protein
MGLSNGAVGEQTVDEGNIEVSWDINLTVESSKKLIIEAAIVDCKCTCGDGVSCVDIDVDDECIMGCGGRCGNVKGTGRECGSVCGCRSESDNRSTESRFIRPAILVLQ